MKRHADDDDRYTDRYNDTKRQRHSSYHSQRDEQQRHSSGNGHYARRDERYAPVRREDTNARPLASSKGGSSGDRSSQTTRPAGDAPSGVRLLSDARETDPHRLAQRQKQIDYGKNTVGYDRYCAAVPRHQRRRGVHPMTPDKTLNVGKKAFDGMVRKWRQALHKYDPPELQAAASAATTTASAMEQATSASRAPPPPAAAAVAVESVDPASSSSSTAVIATDDAADLDPARHLLTAASCDVPTLSIYENFVEGDLDDDDDDLL